MSKQSVSDRFWAKVNKATSSGCWEWTAGKHQDYGVFGISSTHLVKAHRFAYEEIVGPIPEGLILDHLCRNRSCVNPAHLEPVTNKENVLRGEGIAAKNAVKTHCKHGHEFTEENTYITYRGDRSCRTCQRSWNRKRRLRIKNNATKRKA